MHIKKNNEVATAKAPAHYFTGEATLQALVKNEYNSCNVLSVTFEPGARNYWHTHPVGQILIATTGRGYVQKRGEPIRVLEPGDVVSIFPGEEHWHGAAPGSAFTHLAINLLNEKGEETVWLEEVTEEEYKSYR